MSLQYKILPTLIAAAIAVSAPTAMAEEIMNVNGHRLSLGFSYLGGSLNSETFEGGAIPRTTGGITSSLSGAAEPNIDNSLFGVGLDYKYIFQQVPIGIGIGAHVMVGGSVKQGATDVRTNNDLMLFTFPITLSYNFNAGPNFEPYVYFVDYLTSFSSTPKGAAAGLPASGGFNVFSPGGGAGFRYYFSPTWGLDFNAEYVSLNLNSSFTGNAAAQTVSRGRIVNGTQYTRNRNGGHFSVGLGVSAKF